MNQVTRFTDFRGDGVQRECTVGGYVVSAVFAYRDGRCVLDETCVFGYADDVSSVVGVFADFDVVVSVLRHVEEGDSR